MDTDLVELHEAGDVWGNQNAMFLESGGFFFFLFRFLTGTWYCTPIT